MPFRDGKRAESVLKPEVDWRTVLWKFTAKTPSDLMILIGDLFIEAYI